MPFVLRFMVARRESSPTSVAVAVLAAGLGVMLPALASGAAVPSCVASWGSSGSAPGQFFFPRDIAVHKPTSTVYVSDFGNSRVQKFSPSGQHLGSWRVDMANGLDVDAAGLVYVAAFGRVLVFGSDGTPVDTIAFSYPLSFYPAEDVVVGPSGSIYSAVGDTILKFSSAGVPLAKWGAAVGGYASLACNKAEEVFVIGDGEDVLKFSANGTPVCSWTTEPVGTGSIAAQFGIAIDRAGRILAAVTDGIQVYRECGTRYTSWGGFGSACGQFMDAAGVALDGDGRVYVLDKVAPNVEVFDYTVPVNGMSWGTLKARYR